MALLPTNPRDQRFLFLGIIGVVLAVLYWDFVWSDKNDDLTRLAVCADSLDSANVRADSLPELLKTSSGVKARKDSAEYSRELKVLQTLVPVQTEVPKLLKQISDAAREAGLELADLKPDGTLPGDHFDTYKYTLAVTGPYHQIGEFLTNIGKLERIVVPINVKLNPSAKRVGEIKAGPREILLDASFGIETYVRHPAPTVAPAPSDSGKTLSGCQMAALKFGVKGIQQPKGAGKS